MAGTERIDIVQADLSAVMVDTFDVVLANLTAAVLKRHVSVLRGLVGEGTLVVSGFSPDELADIACAVGLDPRVTSVEGEWAAAIF